LDLVEGYFTFLHDAQYVAQHVRIVLDLPQAFRHCFTSAMLDQTLDGFFDYLRSDATLATALHQPATFAADLAD
jgi:hypothetical protein